MTRVINIYKEPYDVYIGRAGKGKSGYFGNHHIVGWCLICKSTHKRGEAIEAFRKDFKVRVETDIVFREKLEELRGKILGCFCKPDLCHGDVYLEYFENN